MKSNHLHRIIAVWSVAIALLPMGVQFVHALENHTHDLCELEYIQHYHDNQLDCEYNHFLFNSSATLNSPKEELEPEHLYKFNLQLYSNNLIGIKIISTSTRAPPFFII